MQYDFASREREMGRMVFALTLDRKRLTERIVIGREEEAHLAMEHIGADVLFDAVRPLGSLLVSFESDPARQWNVNAMILRESYGKTFPMEAERWKMAAPVSAFLRAKYESGEPSALFAAVKTWDEYLNCYTLNHGADMLIDRLSALYRPFFLYDESRPWQEEATAALSKALRDEESTVSLWYPVAKRPFECVVASSSFLPVIAYYLHKNEEWRFVFQECKICGKHFLARSRHYELCSDACRKKQAVEAKRQYDERIKGSRLEELDEAAYYYWYNRLRKLRKGSAADPDKAAALAEAFRIFRKEAVQRKKQVKAGQISLAEFSSWLIQQQNEADRLMEG